MESSEIGITMSHEENVRRTKEYFQRLARRKRKSWWHYRTICLKLIPLQTFITRVFGWTVRKLWFATLGRWLFLKRLRPPYAEPASIDFVRRHTKIPVPTVWCTVPFAGSRWMVLSRIKGKAIRKRGWDEFDTNSQDQIIIQLRDMVAQLRAIEPPVGPEICSVLGGPVEDLRLCTDEPLFYIDEQQMNFQLRLGRSLNNCQNLPYHTDLVASHTSRHPIVFTHGDIALRNVMAEGATITALIDWECAGWFPAHWEYVKAHFGAGGQQSFTERIREFIPPYDLEMRADKQFGWGLPKWKCI